LSTSAACTTTSGDVVVFGDFDFDSTLVTEFSLVCDKSQQVFKFESNAFISLK
jgi:hypothetical protein